MTAVAALVLTALVGCSSGGSSPADTTVAAATTTTTTTVPVADEEPTSTAEAPADTTAQEAAPETTAEPGDDRPGPGSDQPDGSGEPLREPTGTFLSSHRLSQTGSGVPDRARSVCNTTAGATCTITFTRDGVTRQLPPRTTDALGTAEWDWSVSELGLQVGHWDVQVTASRESEKRSVEEAIGLEVVD